MQDDSASKPHESLRHFTQLKWPAAAKRTPLPDEPHRR